MTGLKAKEKSARDFHVKNIYRLRMQEASAHLGNSQSEVLTSPDNPFGQA